MLMHYGEKMYTQNFNSVSHNVFVVAGPRKRVGKMEAHLGRSAKTLSSG